MISQGMSPTMLQDVKTKVSALESKGISTPDSLIWDDRIISRKRGHGGIVEEPSISETVRTERVVKKFKRDPYLKLRNDPVFFIDNLLPKHRNKHGVPSNEGIVFGLQEHLGIHPNDILRLDSRLVTPDKLSNVRDVGGNKHFKSLPIGHLFTNGDMPKLSTVHVLKMESGVYDGEKVTVARTSDINSFASGKENMVTGAFNLGETNVKVEYDHIVNLLSDYLGSSPTLRSNDHLVTLSNLLDNYGRERLVYLIINLVGIRVKGTGYAGSTVQVVPRSIHIPSGASVLDTMSSMFLWF